PLFLSLAVLLGRPIAAVRRRLLVRAAALLLLLLVLALPLAIVRLGGRRFLLLLLLDQLTRQGQQPRIAGMGTQRLVQRAQRGEAVLLHVLMGGLVEVRLCGKGVLGPHQHSAAGKHHRCQHTYHSASADRVTRSNLSMYSFRC